MYPVIVFFLLTYGCCGGGSVALSGLTTSHHQVALAKEHLQYIKTLHTAQREGVETNLLSINCSEIDWTFFYEPPFLHQKLPKCGDVIQPQIVLLRPGRECQIDPYNLPNNATDQCVEQLLWNDKVEEVVIMVHGFLKSLSSSKWMHKLAGQLLSSQTRARAALLIGWGHGSGALPFRDPAYYWQAAANTRYMGVSVARVLSSVVDKMTVLSNDPSYPLSFHCIGHSLGAHICGFTGQTLRTISHIILKRISGLDPAGPLFALDVPYPFNWLNISPQARLNQEDAEFVDVIHTDGRARFHWSILPQYGTMTRMGHVDFFPGSGTEFGWNQPGCWQVQDIGSCSHSRSHDLYVASVINPCTAEKACTNSSIIPNSCSNITQSAPVMGYWVDKDVSSKAYTVETKASEPFCNTADYHQINLITPKEEEIDMSQLKKTKLKKQKIRIRNIKYKSK